jgi:hypothetical protein
MYKPALLVAAIAAVAEARQCTNIMVPVSLESRNGRFNVQLPETEIEATNFALELTRQGRNYTDLVLEEVRFPALDWQVHLDV